MDQPDREAAPQFSQPFRQIMLMLIVLGLSGFGIVLALPRVLPVFEANPYLNGFICLVFLIGVIACFAQVFQLSGSVRWIERFARATDAGAEAQAPRLLAPLAALLRTRGKRMQIGASSTRSILDSVAQRIDEAREITRYIVNLLIFLGLLGTFYGLATTVPALIETIRSLAPQEGEGGVEVFGRLMGGLEAQLGGMGVAFGSSLLGLAGSLIVGLLELFAGHGQNRFYRELEEWLSTITRLGFSSGDGEGGVEHSVLAAVMDHMGEQMDGLQRMFESADTSRSIVEEKLSDLADALAQLTLQMEEQPDLREPMTRVMAGQERVLGALAEQPLVAPMGRVIEGQEKMLAALADQPLTEPLIRLAEAQERLLDKLAHQPLQEPLARLIEGQERLLEKLEQRPEGEGMDAESRMRLRSIDVQMLRLLEEISAGRQESMAELQVNFAALARVITQAMAGAKAKAKPEADSGQGG